MLKLKEKRRMRDHKKEPPFDPPTPAIDLEHVFNEIVAIQSQLATLQKKVLDLRQQMARARAKK